MIPILSFPSEKASAFLRVLSERGAGPDASVLATVSEILQTVRTKGDDALYSYTEQFDRIRPASLELAKDEVERIASYADQTLCDALKRAAENIRVYHEAQKAACATDFSVPAKDGEIQGRVVPMERAGIYVPGGTAAYPSSVLMCAIPARVAGVREIIMVTPPRKNEYGLLEPAVAAAARIAGVDRIFCVGGAQSIAALAYGTESVPRVDLICGPGNIYVTAAKKLVTGAVAIDMLAGPSEILILADKDADPDFVAADLLSQSEHDKLASAVLLTDCADLATAVQARVEARLAKLPRREIAEASIERYGAIFVTDSLSTAVELSNTLAPEHLELALKDPDLVLPEIRNAGSIFLGRFSPEPVGDYYAGANHVLPTMGGARFSSQLGVYHFLKRQSVIRYGERALIGAAEDIRTLAYAEGLSAHAQSVEARLSKPGDIA